MGKTIKLILVILFLFVAFSIFGRWPSTHISYYAPGPIQAIGNKNRLLVFLEFSLIVHHPRPRASCLQDVPSVYPEGNFQEVLVLDRTGLIDRIRVSIDNGISFNPNLGDIYIDNDRIYLHSPPSMNYRRSIFEWKTDHFELLPLKVSEQIFAKMGMRENNIASFRRSMRAFDEVTARSGWKKVFKDFISVDKQFVWEDCEIRIEESERNKDFFEITLQSSRYGSR
jgi:hypothetical protein